MSTVRTLKLCVLFTGWVSFLGGGCDLSVLSLGLFVCFVVVVGVGGYCCVQIGPFAAAPGKNHARRPATRCHVSLQS